MTCLLERDEETVSCQDLVCVREHLHLLRMMLVLEGLVSCEVLRTMIDLASGLVAGLPGSLVAAVCFRVSSAVEQTLERSEDHGAFEELNETAHCLRWSRAVSAPAVIPSVAARRPAVQGLAAPEAVVRHCLRIRPPSGSPSWTGACCHRAAACCSPAAEEIDLAVAIAAEVLQDDHLVAVRD